MKKCTVLILGLFLTSLAVYAVPVKPSKTQLKCEQGHQLSNHTNVAEAVVDISYERSGDYAILNNHYELLDFTLEIVGIAFPPVIVNQWVAIKMDKVVYIPPSN